MGRGIYIRESDLNPLVTLLGRVGEHGYAEGRFEMEALETLLALIRDALAGVAASDIQRDRRLRYEFGDDVLAYTEAGRHE